MINKMIILSIIFFPLQNFAVWVAGSRYDITSFIILFIAFYVSIKNQIFNKKTVLLFLLFIISQLFIFSILGTTPFYRLFSGMVWLGGLLLVILSKDRIIYNPTTAYKTILIVLILTSCIMIYEFFSNQGRPSAGFQEPSYAALPLFSAAASIVGLIYFFKLPRSLFTRLFCGLLILFVTGIITLSMHIVTFVLTVILIGILSFPVTYSKIKTQQLIYFSFIILFIFLGVQKLMTMDYFLIKFDVWNVLNNNLSVLSWRIGYDQMIASIIRSPILGNGLGSTGFIEFESSSLDRLLSFFKFKLNLTDAYSLTFRLIIEIGLPLFLFMIYLFIKKIWKLKKYLIISREIPLSHSVPVVFNLLFSVSIIIGCFIKEPLYPSSLLYLGTLLFVTSKIE